MQFQRYCRLPANGRVDTATKDALADDVVILRYSRTSRFTQYPGRSLAYGMTDHTEEVE